MARLEFKDINFKEDGESVEICFLGLYTASILKKDLKRIGEFTIGRNFVEFEASEKSVNTKFSLLLEKAFADLKSMINGRKTFYIHQNSGIPLVGTNEFGIADRDTNWLELKPMTGCNLDCAFCSLSEGSKKQCDYVVEEEYLVQEAYKIINLKNDGVNIHIGPQGEPLLYRDLAALVRDMRKNPKVKNIICVTNGTLLTKEKIDELAKAGLTRLHISLHATNQKIAETLAGKPYNLDNIITMAHYAKSRMDVILVPLISFGLNENEIENLIILAKKIYPDNPKIIFQNYLRYPKGKKPVKERDFKEFFNLLEKYEKKHGIKLVGSDLGSEFREDKVLKKPFKKGDTVKAQIVLPGRYRDEMIAAAQERCITIVQYCNDNKNLSKNIGIKIIRDKHNIFKATAGGFKLGSSRR